MNILVLDNCHSNYLIGYTQDHHNLHVIYVGMSQSNNILNKTQKKKKNPIQLLYQKFNQQKKNNFINDGLLINDEIKSRFLCENSTTKYLDTP